MKRVLLIQHESFEALGTLDPLLKKEGIRIRYVNFERNPEAEPSIDGYDGLILMGGYMGVYEAHIYPHLKIEMQLIEKALKRNIPILGICLGSQILAHVLGAVVRKHTEREMGWVPVHLTDLGRSDSIFHGFKASEVLFQSHGDTFDIPKSADHLAFSEVCHGQAFRYGENVYGFQFHIEIDRPTIEHWIGMPENQEIFRDSGGRFVPERILMDTAEHLDRSVRLSAQAFRNFLKISGAKKPKIKLGSGR
ncbi:MAG: type 1 glutamine amidotransferase [Bdellovibrionales bacterium]|nr:type 1 glutamine amidotransferase [Bdellovibrionales bacterium]